MRRFVFGTVASFGLAAVVWEAFARSGLFSPALSPSLAVIVPALVQMVVSGSIFVHIAYTLYRILWGLGLAALLGVPVGILMGRFKAAERFVLPLVSVLSPIPSLAWVPVFILWFGLGNAASVALVCSPRSRRWPGFPSSSSGSAWEMRRASPWSSTRPRSRSS